MKTKVLVVEDEPDILEILSYNLKREGFEVISAENGFRGLSLAENQKPDLILLDLMLPGMDGIEICKTLKNNSATRNILIIMVTAKGEESDVVLGLGVGADDYITKPFSPKEMVARVKAVLRRGTMVEDGDDGQSLISIGNLTIDTDRHMVTVQGNEIKLTATEFRLLRFLAKHPGRVFSREQILSKALGEDVVVIDRNIDVHIRGIRKKMALEPPVIETIRGVGYRLRENN